MNGERTTEERESVPRFFDKRRAEGPKAKKVGLSFSKEKKEERLEERDR
jgi:hypothetical protein